MPSPHFGIGFLSAIFISKVEMEIIERGIETRVFLNFFHYLNPFRSDLNTFVSKEYIDGKWMLNKPLLSYEGRSPLSL